MRCVDRQYQYNTLTAFLSISTFFAGDFQHQGALSLFPLSLPVLTSRYIYHVKKALSRPFLKKYPLGTCGPLIGIGGACLRMSGIVVRYKEKEEGRGARRLSPPGAQEIVLRRLNHSRFRRFYRPTAGLCIACNP
jgi:hypothetical protein